MGAAARRRAVKDFPWEGFVEAHELIDAGVAAP